MEGRRPGGRSRSSSPVRGKQRVPHLWPYGVDGSQVGAQLLQGMEGRAHERLPLLSRRTYRARELRLDLLAPMVGMMEGGVLPLEALVQQPLAFCSSAHSRHHRVEALLELAPVGDTLDLLDLQLGGGEIEVISHRVGEPPYTPMVAEGGG